MNSSKLERLISELNSRRSTSTAVDDASRKEDGFTLRVVVLEGDLSPGWVAHITEGHVAYDMNPDNLGKADLEIKIKSSSDAEHLLSGAVSLETFLEEGRLKFRGDFAALSENIPLIDSLMGQVENLP